MPTLRAVTEADIEFVKRIKKIAVDEFHLAQAQELVDQEQEELEETAATETERTFFSADIYRMEHIKVCLMEEKNRLLEIKRWKYK